MDYSSGARELVKKMLNYVKIMLERNISISEIKNFLINVMNIRPSIKPIYNSSKILLRALDEGLDKRLIMIVNNLSDHLDKSSEKIAKNLKDILLDESVIMTISKSSTILESITMIERKKIKEIYVLRSHPLNEGISTAEILAKKGFKVKLISDSAAGFYIKNIDLILVGADSILKNGFINKIGTYTLAILAHSHNKPLIVISDSLKICLDLEEYQIEYGDIQDIYKGSVKNLCVENPLFEFVPNKYVTLYVTESGTFLPNNVEMSVKKFFQIICT